MPISQIPIFIKTSITTNSGRVRNQEIDDEAHQENYNQRRNSLESTWGSELNRSKFYPIYVVGSSSPTPSTNYQILNPESPFPTLEADTTDAYHYIHRKLQVAFKWFMEECTAEHAIIVDDDTFINWKELDKLDLSSMSADIYGCPWGHPADMADSEWLQEKEEAFGLTVGTLMRGVDPLVVYPQGGAGIILKRSGISALADNLYFENPGYDDAQIASVIAASNHSYQFVDCSSFMIPFPTSVYGAGTETHLEYAEQRSLGFLTLHDMKESSMWNIGYNRLKA